MTTDAIGAEPVVDGIAGYHFLRCLSCRRVIVREYTDKNKGPRCNCGSGFRTSPAWPLWHEFLRPTVAFYSLRCLWNDWRGRS